MRLFEIIDTWTGHWILPDGEILTVDHSKDLHHIELAYNWYLENDPDAIGTLLDAYEDEEEAIEDDYLRDEIAELAIHNDGWVRTMIRDTQFAIDLPSNPTNKQKRILQRMLKDHPDFEIYAINDTQFTDLRKALQQVGRA